MTSHRFKLTLAVLIVLALCAAVAARWFQHFQNAAQRTACLDSLRQIDEIQTCCIPLSDSLAFGERMNPEKALDCFRDRRLPKCPAGGEYSISWVVGGPYPTCSVHGNLLQEVNGDRKFKGGIRKAGSPPLVRRPRLRSPPGIYVSKMQPPPPDLGALKRAAALAIDTLTNGDPDLKGHGLELWGIRYEHKWLPEGGAAGVSYQAIYSDTTLRHGNATGVRVEVRGDVAYFQSQKGLPLFSTRLEGKTEVPEDLVTNIAFSAITNFWPQTDTSHLSLYEIVCCDPLYYNDYTVDFRLTGLLAGPGAEETQTRIKLYIQTNGVVREDRIQWDPLHGTLHTP